ncbi:MAG: ABC transporter permease, partial [Azonexus sp.]
MYRLGVKELWSLARDPAMLVLIAYVFTVGVYTAATAMPETLHKVPSPIVAEDEAPLSQRIVSAFYPPQFNTPEMIAMPEIDPGMDNGRYTFVLHIPQGFQRDVLARRVPEIQLNVDATRMSQAFTGSGAVQQIVLGEVDEFVLRQRAGTALPVDLALRARFNPALEKSWFGGLTQIINYITMLSIVLTGAALIREREHGTIEHLLVMPVTPSEIMLAKVWSMGLVVLVAAFLSLNVIVRGLLGVPVEGSLALFFAGAALTLFATT